MKAIRTLKNSLLKTALLHPLFLLLCCSVANAQGRGDDGATPLAMQTGTPAGSYALSGFESVNPYNGSLNFALPLLHIGGRGGAQFTMTIKNEIKWKVSAHPTGSTSYLYTPLTSSWTPFEPGYGPGIMVGRVVGLPGLDSCPDESPGLTRLTFITPDGTEYEFRDAPSEGAPNINAYVSDGNGGCINTQNFNRGRVFITRDGTSATFISETDIHDYYGGFDSGYVPNLRGHMFMADGTCYRIYDGLVQWIRDRNGNKLSFEYDPIITHRVTKITDSLNRQVTISYATNFDTLTYQGFGGATRTIKIYYDLLQNLLRPNFPLQTYAQLFPNLNGSSQTPFNPRLMAAVELPDLRRYEFLYNSYGELGRVKLPTGGGFEYDWDNGIVGNPGGSVLVIGEGNRQIYRRIVERRVYTAFNPAPVRESRATYSRPEVYPVTTANADVMVNHYSPSEELLSREWHSYYGTASASFFQSDVGYSKWRDGKEYRTEIVDSDGNTVLQRLETTWEQLPLSGWWGSDSGVATAPPINTRTRDSKTTWTQNNQVNKQEFFYDQYNNKTEVKEYDFDTGAPGGLVRRSTTSYVTLLNGYAYNTVNPNTTNPDPEATLHIRNLPLQQSIYDNTGNEKARSTFEYDNYLPNLTPRSEVSGHDSNKYNSSFIPRGNPTQATKWVLQTGAPLNSRMQYDMLGNVTSVTDPRQKTTYFEFLDRFGSPDAEAQGNTPPALLNGKSTFAFATKVTNALGQSAYTQFDYYLGKPVNGEDANHTIASGRYGGYADGTYTDALDRATELIVGIYPSNPGLELRRRTRFQYDDTSHLITTTGDQTSLNDGALKSQTLYDGLGRAVEARQYAPEGLIKTETRFDGLGRQSQVSNPYRTGETVYWTTMVYDGLSRVKTVTAPDTSIVTTIYNGNQTTVIDQANKQRRSITDGLGRLKQVDEMNELPSTSVYASTTYLYDALDNLVQVSQGSQTRRFAYDSLSRLIFAANPEQLTSGALVYNNQQWAVKYEYDENSNLRFKTDSRLVTTGPGSGQLVKIEYQYDDLNRVVSRLYNDNLTPNVNYFYENPQILFSTGRLTKVSSAASLYEHTAFDVLGRVKQSQQTTQAQSYQMDYWYNLAGAPTKERYPSGREISTSYDTAGRLSGLSGARTGEATKTYVSQLTYTAHGAVAQMNLGNTLIERAQFNSRLQPTQIKLGTASNPSSALELDYTYGVRVGAALDATKNNGNVEGQRILISGALDVTESYTYDQCNRLLTAEEKTTGGQAQQWKQTFIYDRFGNRNFNTNSTQTTPNVLEANPLFDPNTTTNRYQAGQGYSYDNAGNLTQEPSSPTSKSYAYDGENHQIEFTTNAQTTRYEYDGDGRRVKKINPTGTALVCVYDAAGRLIAEYDSGGGASSGNYQTKYLTADQLGSTRVVTDATGAVTTRFDYLPFGSELGAGIGGRTTAMMYSVVSNLRQKYTGHERDAESGLDFAQARYCSSTSGRFMSADSVAGSPSNPQSLNLYAYVMNNPTKYSDPTGHEAQNQQQTTNQTEIPSPPSAPIPLGILTLTWNEVQTLSGSIPITNPATQQISLEAQAILENLYQVNYELYYASAMVSILTERNGNAEISKQSSQSSVSGTQEVQKTDGVKGSGGVGGDKPATGGGEYNSSLAQKKSRTDSQTNTNEYTQVPQLASQRQRDAQAITYSGYAFEALQKTTINAPAEVLYSSQGATITRMATRALSAADAENLVTHVNNQARIAANAKAQNYARITPQQKP